MAFRSAFKPSSPDYAGVLASADDQRLIVSLRGATYALQVASGDLWSSVKTFHCASQARAYFGVVAVDPPFALVEAVAGLPDDPRNCASIPVPDTC